MPPLNKAARGWSVIALLVMMLGVGLFAGAVWAQQNFGPEDVKSVPKSFIEGGDRSAALLEQILTTLQQQEQNQRALLDIGKGIEQKLDALAARPEHPRERAIKMEPPQ